MKMMMLMSVCIVSIYIYNLRRRGMLYLFQLNGSREEREVDDVAPAIADCVFLVLFYFNP